MSFLPALTGSLSHPALDNPTGVMVEAGYRHHGLDVRYVNCDVLDLAAAVAGARAMGWLGFNCSLPHKESVVALLDELTSAAQLIGAVNCVKIDGGRLLGENTDGKGFVASLLDTTSLDGRELAILGAGGAARAIAVEAALGGAARMTIVNRDLARAQAVADIVTANTSCEALAVGWEGPLAVPPSADVLVNATSVGMRPHEDRMPSVDVATLRPDLVVADVVANPPTTRLLQAAADAGCRTVDGRGMLVNQAIAGVVLWTGVTLDAAVLHAALDDALS